MYFLSNKISEWKIKAKDAINAENIIDLTVDILLVFLDVLLTPILLPIRIAKHYLKKVVGYYIKKHSRQVVNKIKNRGINNG